MSHFLARAGACLWWEASVEQWQRSHLRFGDENSAENLQTSDVEHAAMVDHQAVRHADADNHHDMDEVTHGLQACPAVTGGEGLHRWYGHRQARHSCLTLGHVNETVEVMAPLEPQLCPLSISRPVGAGC
jgi:hypothetical protein